LERANNMIVPMLTALGLESKECTEDRQEVASFSLGFFMYELLHKRGIALGLREGGEEGPLRAVVVFREFDPVKEGRQPRWMRKVASTYIAIEAYMAIRGDPTGIPAIMSDTKKRKTFQKCGKEWQEHDEHLWQMHLDNGPREPHWYVGIVASDPATQGRGHCREVMDLLVQAADERGVPCYLECTERERPYYEKFGFKTVSSQTFCVGGQGEFPGCLMNRQPRCGVAP